MLSNAHFHFLVLTFRANILNYITLFICVFPITNFGWITVIFDFQLHTSILIVRFYISNFCHCISKFIFYTSITLLYYQGRKKVKAWRHKIGIIVIWSRRNAILFYATALTWFLPCVCIYIHIFSLFSSILRIASYLSFEDEIFLRVVHCNNLSQNKMIFIILKCEFTKIPFETKCWLSLTTMSCHVRLVFLAYPHSTHHYECVGANET